MTYEHTQSGWPMRIAFGVAALGLLAMTALGPFARPAPRAALVGGALLAVLVGAVMGRMNVRIGTDRLHWSYGPGWPRFSVPLADLLSVEVTRTTLWEGWGVHRTRRGWLYNIAGYDAVLVTRRDGKRFLLGTDEPRRLRAALDRAIARPGERIRA